MKTSRGVSVVGLSAALVATGWAMGTGFLTPAKAISLPTDTAAGSTGTESSSTATPSTAASADPSTTAFGSATPSPTPTETTPAAPATYNGSSVNTRYGAFQAQITVENGQVTDIVMLQNGDGDHTSRSINAQAIPTLTQRVLEAQSANVDAVSGASFTSYGFLTSVESALQEAGL